MYDGPVDQPGPVGSDNGIGIGRLTRRAAPACGLSCDFRQRNRPSMIIDFPFSDIIQIDVCALTVPQHECGFKDPRLDGFRSVFALRHSVLCSMQHFGALVCIFDRFFGEHVR